MNTILPCVLMRAGTSRGPFFLREWLPEGDEARDQALIGAIGASDPLQLDGVGGGSTLNSKVAIVSRSSQPNYARREPLALEVPSWPISSRGIRMSLRPSLIATEAARWIRLSIAPAASVPTVAIEQGQTT